jgi:O-methyltransferase
VPGDLVECGVCKGGSAAALVAGLDLTDRHVWLFDSFQGLPATTHHDGEDAKAYVGQCVGDVASVAEAMRLVNCPLTHYTIRAGWFNETFADPLPHEVALLHIDADWYRSVLLCLETFFDRVAEGGLIVLDDFGYWEGCREAFYEFTRSRDLKPLLERCGPTQAWWIKGRTHNRPVVDNSCQRP